jgi:putative PIN family toxin of toxin-antitoxin system
MPLKNSRVNIVIDPNILISATLTKSTRRKVYNLLVNPRFRCFYCPELFNEYKTVISRPKFQKYVTPAQVQRFIQWAKPLMSLKQIKTFVRLSRDENDNYLLSLSLDSNSLYLLTGDDDLLVLKKFFNTKIVTITAFCTKHSI